MLILDLKKDNKASLDLKTPTYLFIFFIAFYLLHFISVFKLEICELVV